ncbi:probable E3 ubiquitin-protein ligase LUL3 [Ananas comosus]|uniref:RING-type E3 ubiquitin transferase n=1 Tax=Ananas comosus TaxID=4615 RepID=A0A6P5G9L2_ANACO|nr:probable E3 ubiquitin-protein ligase LUL3 [Ananas comosus]
MAEEEEEDEERETTTPLSPTTSTTTPNIYKTLFALQLLPPILRPLHHPSSPSSLLRPPSPPPPPYVEHQRAKTVKNDVNVHRDAIGLVPDERDPEQHLVSFTYDALVDGSFTIYYFAKEGADCSFSSVYPDLPTSTKTPFQKGLAQKFVQPSGSGIDLGFFDLDDLSKPLNGEIFPLVIYAEACPPPTTDGVQMEESRRSAQAQITLAVIEKNSSTEAFQVKVVKQILWAEGERYELQVIFGLVNSAEAEVSGADKDDDMGKECVICLSEPRNTAVFPCRHMCMCSECARALTLQSNKCPICRQPVEKVMEIKVSDGEQ